MPPRQMQPRIGAAVGRSKPRGAANSPQHGEIFSTPRASSRPSCRERAPGVRLRTPGAGARQWPLVVAGRGARSASHVGGSDEARLRRALSALGVVASAARARRWRRAQRQPSRQPNDAARGTHIKQVAGAQGRQSRATSIISDLGLHVTR